MMTIDTEVPLFRAGKQSAARLDKDRQIAEQAHLSWDGVGPAAELNTPFTMNSISNAYDNI